jgi:putative addiction module component (TIGR02574 family)
VPVDTRRGLVAANPDIEPQLLDAEDRATLRTVNTNAARAVHLGTVKGRTIELDDAPPLDGRRVIVTLAADEPGVRLAADVQQAAWAEWATAGEQAPIGDDDEGEFPSAAPKPSSGASTAAGPCYLFSMSAARILEQALALPPSEREELASQLVDSLRDAHIPGVLGPGDRVEIRRRAAEAFDGAPGIPFDEVRAKLFT